MSADTPKFGIVNNPEGISSTDVMIKDGFLVPTSLRLNEKNIPKQTLLPITDDSSATAAATTYLEIQRRQVARVVNSSDNYPFINGTPEGEAALVMGLHSKLTEYGHITGRWPHLSPATIVTLNPRSNEGPQQAPGETTLVRFPQQKALPAGRLK
jgi:hypothetical protein